MPTAIAARNFSNTAPPTNLTSNIDNAYSTQNISVQSTAGYPPTPFTACMDRNTISQEFVLVTNTIDTLHFSAIRGYDGTPPVNHLAITGTFEHCTGAIDFREANQHHTDPTRDDHLQYAHLSGIRPFTGLQTFSGGIAPSSIVGAVTYPSLQTFAGGISTPSIAGTTTFANIPLGPNADPTTANQLARKSYVDAKASAAQSAAISSAVSTAENYTNANAVQWQGNNGYNEVQGGWVGVIASSTGAFTYTYPHAFTNATLLVVAGVGTSANHTTWHVQVNPNNSRTGFGGRIASTNIDSNPAAGSYTICYIAMGY